MKEDLRQNFIDAAARLFAEEGFEKVTIRKIASLAGGNSAMISYYFGNKSGLYLEVLRFLFSEYDNKLKIIIQEDKGSLGELKSFLKAIHSLYEECPYFTSIISHESGKPSDEFKKALVEHENRHGGDYLCNLLSSGIESGEIRSDIDPKYMARIVSLLANYFKIAMELLAIMCPQCDISTEIYFEHVSKIIFTGLAKEKIDKTS